MNKIFVEQNIIALNRDILNYSKNNQLIMKMIYKKIKKKKKERKTSFQILFRRQQQLVFRSKLQKGVRLHKQAFLPFRIPSSFPCFLETIQFQRQKIRQILRNGPIPKELSQVCNKLSRIVFEFLLQRMHHELLDDIRARI